MAKGKSAIGAAIVANVGELVATLVDNEQIAGAKKPIAEAPVLKRPEPPGARPRAPAEPLVVQGTGDPKGGKKGPKSSKKGP